MFKCNCDSKSYKNGNRGCEKILKNPLNDHSCTFVISARSGIASQSRFIEADALIDNEPHSQR